MAELFLRFVQILVGNAWNRAATILIVAGVAAINGWVQFAVAQLLNVDIPDTPWWIGFILVLIGVLILVLSRVLPEQRTESKVNAHDVELLQQFRALISPDLVRFLQRHNFRNPFYRKKLDPVHELAWDWNGAHFEFQDAELQVALEKVVIAAAALSEKVAERIYCGDGNFEIGQPLTDMDKVQGIHENTRRAIDDMNKRSSAVATAINDFERLARRKLPVR